MNICLAAAGALCILVGLVHSVLGERLIFRRMRHGGLIPTDGGRLLGEGHVRILWASWHVLTVFGWCIAALLIHLSLQPPAGTSLNFIEQAIVVSMLAGSALVLVGTKARHPGWIGLLGAAVLVGISRLGQGSA